MEPNSASPSPTQPDEAKLVALTYAVQGFDGRRTTIDLIEPDGGGRWSPASAVPGGDQTNPDWSPDGTQLTFVVNDAGRDDLWIVDADGTEARKLVDCEDPCDRVDDPAWSPDGESIAVCAMAAVDGDHLGSLVSVDVATGVETTLLELDSLDFCAGARWSNDGRALVMELVHRADASVNAEINGVELVIVDLAADPPAARVLIAGDRYPELADWSPADDLIVFSQLVEAGAEARDLYTIRPDGSDERRLTYLSDSAGSASHAAFDPDGTSVVFLADPDARLLRVDLATGVVSTAFADDTSGVHPRARPIGG